MMMNLFSVFDPSSYLFSSSWMILIFCVIAIPLTYWKVKNPSLVLLKKIISPFKKEVAFNLGKNEKSTDLLIIGIFISILLMNFLALYPQIFSPTSHVLITTPLSLTFWLSLMLFGWMKNTNHMLSHLVPQGTPNMLMNFMVLIEFISNIIRPLTLCVRLTANMIAGHLLMSLLGNTLSMMTFSMSMISMFIPMILTILESAVACIQAYVFMTLITLYVTEVK